MNEVTLSLMGNSSNVRINVGQSILRDKENSRKFVKQCSTVNEHELFKIQLLTLG